MFSALTFFQCFQRLHFPAFSEFAFSCVFRVCIFQRFQSLHFPTFSEFAFSRGTSLQQQLWKCCSDCQWRQTGRPSSGDHTDRVIISVPSEILRFIALIGHDTWVCNWSLLGCLYVMNSVRNLCCVCCDSAFMSGEGGGLRQGERERQELSSIVVFPTKPVYLYTFLGFMGWIGWLFHRLHWSMPWRTAPAYCLVCVSLSNNCTFPKNQKTRELISDRKASQEHSNKLPSHLRYTWHAS